MLLGGLWMGRQREWAREWAGGGGRGRLRSQTAQEVLALRGCWRSEGAMHPSKKTESRKVEPLGQKVGARG